MTTQDAPLAERAKQADYGLYLLGATFRDESRQKIWILSLLYNELNSLVNSTSEEMVGHIRLAWWREHVEALHSDAEAMSPAHPILIELAPIISELSLEAWNDFFDYYSNMLSASHDSSLAFSPSPIMQLLEKCDPKQPIDDAIKTLWSAGELAISKVTPHLHYRYDMALAQSNNDEELIIKEAVHHHSTFKRNQNKISKYNRLERICICISTDRIMSLTHSKNCMHNPSMLRPSAMLPLKLWFHSREP